MVKQTIFQKDEIPFGGSRGKFIAMINKIYNKTTLGRRHEYIDSDIITEIVENTKNECDRIVFNCDRKTAYAYLVSTFNAAAHKADQLMDWRWGQEFKREKFSHSTELTENLQLTHDACEACEEIFTRITELLIEQFPEKVIQNAGILQAARTLPNSNFQRQAIEKYLEKHESKIKPRQFNYEEIFDALKAKKYISKTANLQTFMNGCLGKKIRYEDRIRWIGSRKSCFKLCMILFGEDIREEEINKIFLQAGMVKGIPNNKDLERNDKSGADTRGFMTKLLK